MDPKPMSDNGERLFRMAIDLNRKTVVSQLNQSAVAYQIAKLLAEAAAYQGEVQPTPWADLKPEARARFKALAERAILSIDPSVRQRALEQAVDECSDWLDGPYAGTGTRPTLHDIARQVVSTYEALLCTPEAK